MPDIESTHITNLNSLGYTPGDVNKIGGRKRSKVAEIELDGTQSNADVMRFFRVKSNARVTSLLLSNDALTGLTDADFGLWDIDGGAVVDADLFDAGQTLASALTRQEKRVGTNSALNIDTLDLAVWELLGLSVDPNTEYDVGALLNTAGSASGTVVLEMDYTVD